MVFANLFTATTLKVTAFMHLASDINIYDTGVISGALDLLARLFEAQL